MSFRQHAATARSRRAGKSTEPSLYGQPDTAIPDRFPKRRNGMRRFADSERQIGRSTTVDTSFAGGIAEILAIREKTGVNDGCSRGKSTGTATSVVCP